MSKAEHPAPAATEIMAQAIERQKAYAARRRVWAKAVGRPYTRDKDVRPPPGELDAAADE